jgi:choline dehydrogenase-like flavoprotein
VGSRPYERPFPGCEAHALFSDEYIECFVRQTTQTIYHPVGTAKMGPEDDPTAVVDPELRYTQHLRLDHQSYFIKHCFKL